LENVEGEKFETIVVVELGEESRELIIFKVEVENWKDVAKSYGQGVIPLKEHKQGINSMRK
jgi:hypothetical protein